MRSRPWFVVISINVWWLWAVGSTLARGLREHTGLRFMLGYGCYSADGMLGCLEGLRGQRYGA